MEIGRERIFLECTDSTNSYALTLALRGYPHGTVVMADKQTKGRGRHGRVWHSPGERNIYMSIILRGLQNGRVSLLSLMAAVAVSEAIEENVSVPARVKWPNDVMVPSVLLNLKASDDISYKKVGGILAEARFLRENAAFVVLGIGINVNSTLEDLPPDITDSAITLKVATGRDIDREGLLEVILSHFNKWYGLLINDQEERIINRWREISLTIGREVIAIKEKEVIKGRAMDIDEGGSLLLHLPSGRVERINSAEVIHLR